MVSALRPFKLGSQYGLSPKASENAEHRTLLLLHAKTFTLASYYLMHSLQRQALQNLCEALDWIDLPCARDITQLLALVEYAYTNPMVSAARRDEKEQKDCVEITEYRVANNKLEGAVDQPSRWVNLRAVVAR